MNNLVYATLQAMDRGKLLPFYLYSSIYEQSLKNITITKPTLIFVISGLKEIGTTHTIKCHGGEFIFLSDHQLTSVRNIPNKEEYIAFMLEFEATDFEDIPTTTSRNAIPYIKGQVVDELQELLEQLVNITSWAPLNILAQRRHEILLLLYYLGYQNIVAFGRKSSLSHKIHNLLIENHFQNITIKKLCNDYLFISESTLRRKLQLENKTIKCIKNSAQLGHGCHLLQTTHHSIQYIAEQCGYQSHSRFTENFKKHFGLTPSQLRKTKQKAG